MNEAGHGPEDGPEDGSGYGLGYAPGPGVRDAVVTPEAVPLEFETAGVGSRSVAFALDVGAMAVLAIALLFAVNLSGAVGVPGWLVAAASFLVVLGVQFGYPIAFETLWQGRTPGKAALGLRVVTTEGGPVHFRHAALRAVLGLVDFVLTSGAAAMLTIFISSRNQRLGDLAAGTLVLRERSGTSRAQPARFTPPPDLEEFAVRLDVSGVDAHAYGLVRSFLVRAADLDAGVRDRLARRLAAQIGERVQGPPPPRQIGPGEFLRCVAAAYQARGRGTDGAAGAGGNRSGRSRAPQEPDHPGDVPETGFTPPS